LTPEQQALYALCKTEFEHLTKRASATSTVEAFFAQQKFLLGMMERLVHGQAPPAGDKNAWDRIAE
jgi:hypothetical protein